MRRKTTHRRKHLDLPLVSDLRDIEIIVVEHIIQVVSLGLHWALWPPLRLDRRLEGTCRSFRNVGMLGLNGGIASTPDMMHDGEEREPYRTQ